MDAIIKIENLNLWYEKGKPNQVQALKNINLEIDKGDYVAFFGPSGCGKTSLLHSISGIDRFQEGHIFIKGKDISLFSNQELSIFRQAGVGIVFQQFNLIPSLTVLKNVSLPMLFVGISSSRAEKEARRLLKRLDISELATRYPYELSGGQQQRVGIARALANNAPIIIADEPLGNLDSNNAKAVLDFLKDLNEKDGRTIIMVTHEAWSLKDAKTVFYMKDGEVVEKERIPEGGFAESATKRLQEQISSISGEELVLQDEKISTRILANFLLKGYTINELARFNDFINDFFSGELGAEQFKRLLVRAFPEGGLGLRAKKAEKVFLFIEKAIEMRAIIELLEIELKYDPNVSISGSVATIRQWLIEDYRGKLSEFQIRAIDQVIEDRIRNNVKPNEVVKILDLSNSKFGVGLSFRASSVIAEKLELILNKEIEDISHN